MKNLTFIVFTIIISVNLFSQTKSQEILVKNEPWTTGDVFSNLNNDRVFEGDINVGNDWLMRWVDMRGWAEFDLLAQLSKEKITKLKIKFNVSEESTANDHMVPGSHNLVITKFPFNIRIEKPSVIVDYFDKLDINDSQKIYGIGWEAGESTGIKEVILNENAIKDLYSSFEKNEEFKIGFWEFNDNATKCTISGKDSEYRPRLIIEYK